MVLPFQAFDFKVLPCGSRGSVRRLYWKKDGRNATETGLLTPLKWLKASKDGWMIPGLTFGDAVKPLPCVFVWNKNRGFNCKKICCNQFLWLQQHRDWWEALQRHSIARTHSSEGRASHCFFFSLTCQVAQKIRLGNSRMRFPIYFPSALCIVAMVSLIHIIMVRDRQPLHLGHLSSLWRWHPCRNQL